jgi:hypothetical protein
MNLQIGDMIRVRAFPEIQVERRIVRIRQPYIYLTTEEEWNRASAEGREAICLGFPISDVIDLQKDRKHSN